MMKETGIIVTGAAAGAAIPLLLREYVDNKMPTAGIDWKKPSALVGIVGGVIATALGLFGQKFVGYTAGMALTAAGPAMIVTGAYSALFPKAAPAARAGRTASAKITPTGGTKVVF